MKFPTMIVAIMMLAISAAVAQDKSAGDSNAPPKSSEEFDDAIQEFGVVAGEAFTCLKDEALDKHEVRVRSVYDKMIELFGTERAYKFAVAYGYGAAQELESDKCEETVDAFEDKYGAVAEKHELVD